MKYIKRASEEIIKKAFKTYKAVLITGARQVGKTSIVKELYKNYEYVNFDNSFFEDEARNSGKMFLDMRETPLILDEVQRVPELFRFIKLKCDEENKYGRFILSGSQLFKLMKEATDSLAGRVHIHELTTLSRREIYKENFNKHFVPTTTYIKERKKSIVKDKKIWNIIHRGFYPELQNKEKDWAFFYEDYLKTYLSRDVRDLTKVQNLMTFNKFMVSVASRTGEILNMSNIASEVGINVTTVKEWISILETSGIIYLLEPYASTSLKRAIKAPKLYFRDTGLCSYLTKWPTPKTLMAGNMAGHMFETYVVSEILKSYANEGIDYKNCITYYNGRDGIGQKQSEIDLIIEENGTLYPIEIKVTSEPYKNFAFDKSLLSKIKNKKTGEGALICFVDEVGVLGENTYALPYFYI